MPSYYFVPVDPGYDRITRGIAGGITAAIDGVSQGYQRERQKKLDERAERSFVTQEYLMGLRPGTAPEKITPTTTARGPQLVEPSSLMGGEDGGAGIRFPRMSMEHRGPLEAPSAGVGLHVTPELLMGGQEQAQVGDGAPRLAQPPRSMNLLPRMTDFTREADPRYEQIRPDQYIDLGATPQARSEQAYEARQLLEADREGRKRKEVAALSEQQRVARKEAARSAIGVTRKDLLPEQIESLADAASYDPTIYDSIVNPKPDYGDERLELERQRVRDNREYRGEMLDIARDREGRLAKPDEADTNKARERYRKRAYGHVAGLIRSGAAREESTDKGGVTGVNYRFLRDQLVQQFKDLDPGDADGIVAEALKDHAPNETVSNLPYRTRSENAPTKPSGKKAEPKMEVASDELLDQLDVQFNGDEAKIRAELKRRKLRLQ